MSQEKEPVSEETKSSATLSEARKTALLRYLAILFAFAFILVAVSLVFQMRSTNATILELNETSSSALSNAEALQEENRNLQEQTAELEAKIEELTAQLKAAAEETETAQAEEAELKSKNEELEVTLDALQKELEQTKRAYEALLVAEKCDVKEGNVTYSRAMEDAEAYKMYLGQKGLETYQSLLLDE